MLKWNLQITYICYWLKLFSKSLLQRQTLLLRRKDLKPKILVLISLSTILHSSRMVGINLYLQHRPILKKRRKKIRRKKEIELMLKSSFQNQLIRLALSKKVVIPSKLKENLEFKEKLVNQVEGLKKVVKNHHLEMDKTACFQVELLRSQVQS